jgi:hypothetical protein
VIEPLDQPQFTLKHTDMERIARWLIRHHIKLLETVHEGAPGAFYKLAKKDIAHLTKTLEYFGSDNEGD